MVTATYAAFFFFGIYRGLWRYTGLEDLVRIAQAVACATLLSMAGLIFAYRFVGYSRMVFIVYGLLLFFGVAGSRLSFRFFGLYLRGRPEKVPVLIYGAGDGGEIVVRECRNNSQMGYRPIGFVDDDPRKQGRTVQGLRFLAGRTSWRKSYNVKKWQVALSLRQRSWPTGMLNRFAPSAGSKDSGSSNCAWNLSTRKVALTRSLCRKPEMERAAGATHVVAHQGLGFSRQNP